MFRRRERPALRPSQSAKARNWQATLLRPAAALSSSGTGSFTGSCANFRSWSGPGGRAAAPAPPQQALVKHHPAGLDIVQKPASATGSPTSTPRLRRTSPPSSPSRTDTGRRSRRRTLRGDVDGALVLLVAAPADRAAIPRPGSAAGQQHLRHVQQVFLGFSIVSRIHSSGAGVPRRVQKPSRRPS